MAGFESFQVIAKQKYTLIGGPLATQVNVDAGRQYVDAYVVSPFVDAFGKAVFQLFQSGFAAAVQVDGVLDLQGFGRYLAMYPEYSTPIRLLIPR